MAKPIIRILGGSGLKDSPGLQRQPFSVTGISNLTDVENADLIILWWDNEVIRLPSENKLENLGHMLSERLRNEIINNGMERWDAYVKRISASMPARQDALNEAIGMFLTSSHIPSDTEYFLKRFRRQLAPVTGRGPTFSKDILKDVFGDFMAKVWYAVCRGKMAVVVIPDKVDFGKLGGINMIQGLIAERLRGKYHSAESADVRAVGGIVSNMAACLWERIKEWPFVYRLNLNNTTGYQDRGQVPCQLVSPKYDGAEDIIFMPAVVSDGRYTTSLLMRLGAGALFVIPPPPSLEEIVRCYKRAARMVVTERNTALRAKAQVEEKLRAHGQVNPLVGNSQAILRMYPLILEAAKHPKAHVLVYGETGTGKEVLYNLLRMLTPTQAPHLIQELAGFDDAALQSAVFGHVEGSYTGAKSSRPGALEEAKGGTLFFDNNQMIDKRTYAALLRLLQPGQPYRKFGSDEELHADCRIYFGINESPEELVKSGRMPPDMEERFDVRINIPPLDERKEDIPLLVEAFVREYLKDNGIQQRAASQGKTKAIPTKQVQRWMAESWRGVSGNVRGLRNAVRKYLMKSAISEDPDLSAGVSRAPVKKRGRPVGREIMDGELIGLLRQVVMNPATWTIEGLFKEINRHIKGGSKKMKQTRGNLQTRIRHIAPATIRAEWPEIGDPESMRQTVYKALKRVKGYDKLPR